MDSSSAGQDWCQAHSCDLTPLALAPVEGGANVTPSAVKRMAEDTGLDIIEDPFGVPVRLVDVLSEPEAAGACAFTLNAFSEGRTLGSEIEIVSPPPAGCGPVWRTLMHEAIHAFCPRAKHTTSGGIFDLNANPAVRIDKEAAELLRSCTR